MPKSEDGRTDRQTAFQLYIVDKPFIYSPSQLFFKCLGKHTFMYATPTFIPEVLRLVTLVQLLLATVTVN